MKSSYIILFTCFLFSYSYCQSLNEKILNNSSSNSCFGAVSIGNEVFFNFNSSDYYKGYSKEAIVYKCDNNINIIDSLDLSNYGGFDLFHISNMIPYTDSTFLVFGQGVFQSPYSETFKALVMDKSLNIIKTYDAGIRADSLVGGLSACRVDSFLVVGGYKVIGSAPKPLYMVFNEAGILIKEVVVYVVSMGVVNSLYSNNSLVYAGFRPAQPAQLMQINPVSFEVSKLDTGKYGFAPAGFFDFNNSSNSLYSYGEYFFKYLGLALVDSNLNLTIVDTFSSVNNPNTSTRATVADIGVLASKSEREIYFATGEGAYYIPQQLQPGLITNMKLWRVDTGGNVIWSVLVNDSSYYLPTKTVATNDGGAVFFSMKYDWRIDASPKTSLSIIKLDSTGNFVGLSEIEVPYQNLGIEVFPNPSVDRVSLNGVEARDVQTVTIYTLNGSVVSQTEKPEHLDFDTSFLSSGTYIFQVVLSNGQSAVYKVVKE